MAARYVYEPLEDEEHQIRLLTILPSYELDRVVIKLRTVNLTEAAGNYDALSYMWGPAENACQIWADGCSLMVRANLWHFLKHYRATDLEAKANSLWIDAICIDQQNLSEKGIQVKAMGRVYCCARHVLIWLGETSAEAELKGRDIDLVRNTYLQTPNVQDSPTPYPEYRRELDAMRALSQPTKSLSPADFGSVNRLRRFILKVCYHPYWQRLWIIQEIILARHSPKIIHGHFLLGGDVLGVLRHAIPLGEDIHDELQAQASFRNLVPHTQQRSSSVYTSSLSSLLHFYCLHHCADSRDHIYGLVGLLDPTSPASSIRIDYEVETWYLFLQVLGFMLEEGEYLEGNKARKHSVGILSHVKNLSWALEIRSADIQKLCLKSCVGTQESTGIQESMNIPLHRSLQSMVTMSRHQIPQLFNSCELNVAISAPSHRLYRHPLRFQNAMQSRVLVRNSSQDDTAAFGWGLSSWLNGKHGWLPPWRAQLWTCKLSAEIPIAFEIHRDGTLQIVGYVYAEKESEYKIMVLPEEVQQALQTRFNEKVGTIKESWLKQEMIQIHIPILYLVQLSELGRKTARGISYGDGLLR